MGGRGAAASQSGPPPAARKKSLQAAADDRARATPCCLNRCGADLCPCPQSLERCPFGAKSAGGHFIPRACATHAAGPERGASRRGNDWSRWGGDRPLRPLPGRLTKGLTIGRGCHSLRSMKRFMKLQKPRRTLGKARPGWHFRAARGKGIPWDRGLEEAGMPVVVC